jgi:hypothetical protein
MTKEDLLQIGELLEPINKRLENMATKSDLVAERKHTQKLLEANNRILATILKVELAETNKRIDGIVGVVKAGFQETAKQIQRVEQKLNHVAEDHETRITDLEESADLTHRN